MKWEVGDVLVRLTLAVDKGFIVDCEPLSDQLESDLPKMLHCCSLGLQ